MSDSPFLAPDSEAPLVALKGLRNGYLQLAANRPCECYADMPPELLLAARDWAAQLEVLGAKRVYWITLSEVVRHLHIHLYPRWEEDEPKGLSLFESRENGPQPPWTKAVEAALYDWIAAHGVMVRETQKI